MAAREGEQPGGNVTLGVKHLFVFALAGIDIFQCRLLYCTSQLFVFVFNGESCISSNSEFNIFFCI